ncbi:MAG TPA: hypothetical protein PKV86_03980 [Syntrophobacteraceae bacterium]|nr:hypothetical protein [Syntrophobacteraceae bacterium]
MELPEYITVEEVKRVCRTLGIRDWTALPEPKVMPEEAAAILVEVNREGMPITLERFSKGLEVELEHGTRFRDANVTNNHPILTGKIVLAHFKEALDYYERLEVAELEADLLKATLTANAQKAATLYKKLIVARFELSQAESEQLV